MEESLKVQIKTEPIEPAESGEPMESVEPIESVEPVPVPGQNQETARADAIDNNSSENIDQTNSQEPMESTENGKVARIAFNLRKKRTDRLRIKRQRQMKYLQKHLVPKNALMLINELKSNGTPIPEFTIQPSQEGFLATISINGTVYSGNGTSKNAAKNAACENAFRANVLEKMLDLNNVKAKQSVVNNANELEDSCEMEVDDELNFPIMKLASFAIYKLLSQWQKEGHAVPHLKKSKNLLSLDEEMTVVDSAKPTRRDTLPDSYAHYHPTSLLIVMRPDAKFEYTADSSELNNIQYKTIITVDEQVFSATSRTKKDSKRLASALACNSLFKTEFNVAKEI